MDLKPIKVEIEIDSSICRTCLTPNATTSLHEDCDDGSTLGAMLETIAEVCVEEDLPSVICCTCAGDLRSAIAFRRRAQLADQTLRQKGSTNPNFDDAHTILLPRMDLKSARDLIDENNSDIDLSHEEDSLLTVHKRKNKKASAKRPFTNEKTLASGKNNIPLLRNNTVGCSQSLQSKKNTDKYTTISNWSLFTAGKSRYEKTINTYVMAKSTFDEMYQTTNAALFDLHGGTDDNDTSMMETRSTTNDSTDNFDLEKYVPFNEISFEKSVPYDCFESCSPPGSPRRVPSPPRRAPKSQPKKTPVETSFDVETIEIVYDTTTNTIVEKMPPLQTSIDTNTTPEQAAEIDWFLPVIENSQQLPRENESAQAIKIKETESTKDVFSCNLCKKVLNSNLALDDHMRKHHHKCPYPECGGIYKTRTLMQRHIKACHLNQLFVCLTCGEKFASKSLVANHMISHKPKTEKKKETTVQLHKPEIGKKKTIQCQICKEIFVDENKRILHMRRKHPGEKPYKCDKRFVDNTVKKHQEQNNCQMKPCYICAVCGKTWETSSRLQQHMLHVHSKVCNFDCKLCGRKFNLKCNLVSHEKRVHGLHNKKHLK